MTDVHISLPPALRRALDLLIDPPADPDVSKGYLDLLGAARPGAATSRRTPARSRRPGRQRSGRCSTTMPRHCLVADQRMATAAGVVGGPAGWYRAGRRLGSGNITASLARAASPEGLALGVDISEPMLARAVRNEAGPQVGFIKADAQRLPLRDNTIDVAISTAVLQLVPDPSAALAEIARVLRPGGRLAVMVPTAGRLARYWQRLPNVGAHAFDDDEIGDVLEDNGFASVRVKNFGTFQWVRGKKG